MSVGAVNKNTGDRIPTAGMPAIDDALDLTSVNPVQNAIITAALANKQDKTDNSLQTTDKTVVGAINEHEGDISSLMSGLTNVADDVKLNTQDLTTPSRTKNLLPMTLAGIKSVNTAGTWSGNVYTIDTMSFTIETDNYNNVVSILLNGSTSSSITFDLCSNSAFHSDGNYTLTDGITDASSSINITAYKNNNWIGSTANGAFNFSNVVSTDLFRVAIYVNSHAGELTDKSFYPMIRPATITDPTFAPYIPSVESRIEAVESGKVDLRQYYAAASTTEYSIPITRAAAYIISVNIPTGANLANPGLYYVVKQGTSVSKSDLITDVLGLTATISNSNLVLAWTVSNPYGANFSVIPVMEFN